MANRFDSPVDVEADEAGMSGLVQMATAVIVALVTLALFNIHALAAWADGLEPGAGSARVAAIADDVAERMAVRGLDGPRTALNAQWNKVKAARWPDQAPPD